MRLPRVFVWPIARSNSRKNDANVLWMAAYAARQLSMDAQLAKDLAYRSLQLNPNSAIALAMTGWIEAILAEPAKALEHLHRADRLSPRDPRTWFINTGIGMAHFIAGQLRRSHRLEQKSVGTKSALCSRASRSRSESRMSGPERSCP